MNLKTKFETVTVQIIFLLIILQWFFLEFGKIPRNDDLLSIFVI